MKTLPDEFTLPDGFTLRHCRPEDHPAMMEAVLDWWDGRDLRYLLPRLFTTHFADTSFVIHRGDALAAFLVGFLSQARPKEGYIHFVSVHPECRGQGLGRFLYERFFEICRREGRHTVRSCTSPVNANSIAFHRRMGFEIQPGDATMHGVAVTLDYNRPDDPKVLFVKRLEPETGGTRT